MQVALDEAADQGQRPDPRVGLQHLGHALFHGGPAGPSGTVQGLGQARTDSLGPLPVHLQRQGLGAAGLELGSAGETQPGEQCNSQCGPVEVADQAEAEREQESGQQSRLHRRPRLSPRLCKAADGRGRRSAASRGSHCILRPTESAVMLLGLLLTLVFLGVCFGLDQVVGAGGPGRTWPALMSSARSTAVPECRCSATCSTCWRASRARCRVRCTRPRTRTRHFDRVRPPTWTGTRSCCPRTAPRPPSPVSGEAPKGPLLILSSDQRRTEQTK